MFWLVLVLLFALVSSLVIDWRRFQELLPSALVGCLTAGAYSGLPLATPCYWYSDTAGVTENWAIVLLLQFSISPILALWYAQDLPRDRSLPIARTIVFGGMVYCIVLLGQTVGKVSFAPWWPPFLVPINCFLLFVVIWIAQRYYYSRCSSPHRKGDRSARLR